MIDRLVAIFMGSGKDIEHTKKMFPVLQHFKIPYAVEALSGHKLMKKEVFGRMEHYEEKYNPLVYIAVAGQSNGLGPTIAGHTHKPVINCPVYSDKFGGMDILSSLRMPSLVPCSTILDPENAALHAVEILALADKELEGMILDYIEKKKDSLAGTAVKVREELSWKP